MNIPIYLDLGKTPTFRSYTLLENGQGQWHRSKGIKGPARVYDVAPDAVLPAPGLNGELVLVFPDKTTKTVEQCWHDAVEVLDSE